MKVMRAAQKEKFGEFHISAKRKIYGLAILHQKNKYKTQKKGILNQKSRPFLYNSSKFLPYIAIFLASLLLFPQRHSTMD